MRLFEIYECGDPYSRAWDVTEYAKSFDETIGVYRGDLSGMWRKAELIWQLRRLYPDCKIRTRKW